MMELQQVTRQISSNPQNPWIIFNISLFKDLKTRREEKWGWRFLPRTYSEVRNVDESSDDITQHRREVRVNFSSRAGQWHIGQWLIDAKQKCRVGYEEQYATNIVVIEEEGPRYTYNLDSDLQNLITQAILQTRNPADLNELQTKIQSIHFVNGNGYNHRKPWLVFDKQWLYEQIVESINESSFAVWGTMPGKFQTKNDTELKQFLQQEGYLPADQSSNQGPENHSQSNNNSTSSNYTYSNSRNTAYSFSASSNNYNSTTSANSDSESYSSDSCSSSSNYSSSPSTSTASETNENKSDSYANSPNSSADHSSSASSDGSYAGSFSNGGGGSSSPATSPEPKLPSGAATSPPTSAPITKPASSLVPEPSSSEQPNLTISDPLTKQKQQIIQEIQTELKQLPNLNSTELANWKQEIEQMASLEAVKAYQKNLLEKLEEKNQLRQEVGIDSLEIRDKGKNIVPWVVTGGALVGGVVFLIFCLRSKKKNR